MKILPKYKTVHITLSAENFGILKKYANDNGLKVTEYIRSVLIKKAKEEQNKHRANIYVHPDGDILGNQDRKGSFNDNGNS